MASIEEALYAGLTGAAAVSAMVGARVYPKRLPPKPRYPAITFERISDARGYVLAGATGRSNPRLRVHCWATTYADAHALADAVRKTLNGHIGPFGGVRIDAAHLLTDFDFYEEASQTYRWVQDWRFSYVEEE